MTREEDLKLALNAAIKLLEVYEHGDSRMISDEFVSLCCVLMNGTNDSCRDILLRVIETDYSEAREEHRKYINSLVTVTYPDENTIEGYEIVDTFYPYYSTRIENEMHDKLMKLGFSPFNIYDEYSPNKQYYAQYVDSGHERDSSGDKIVLWKRKD